MSEKKRVAVLFGQHAVSLWNDDVRDEDKLAEEGGGLEIFEFDTDEEVSAFWKGINAVDGWANYLSVDIDDVVQTEEAKRRDALKPVYLEKGASEDWFFDFWNEIRDTDLSKASPEAIMASDPGQRIIADSNLPQP